jgi:hypothetical protein
MEALWVAHSVGLKVVHSVDGMVALSGGCDPVVREKVALWGVVLWWVDHWGFHPLPHLLHPRCPEEPCHRKVCDHLSN